MNQFDVIVIGGGAAGLMCAWHAAARGRNVAILEHTKKLGKKILMSGGGRCNFTNLDIQPSNYLCHNPHFVKSALKRYTQWDFIAKVIEHNIPYHERKHGELFCDESAKDILGLLVEECLAAKVRMYTHCEISTVEYNDKKYNILSSLGEWQCESLVIATGGLSIPSMQTTSFAYEIAEQFGMNTLERSAGLVPFTFSDNTLAICKSLSGNAIEVTVTCNNENFTENMLFTHRGLSGPCMLQISNYWRSGQYILIDLLPQQNMAEELVTSKSTHAKSLLKTVLAYYLPKSLVAELESMWWTEHADKPIAEISNDLLIAIGEKLNRWQLKPSGTEGYRTAEVTLGGVDTDFLSSKTMESKVQPKLYFIGECVDVTGHLGGYNFQWAWSSAYAAAQYV